MKENWQEILIENRSTDGTTERELGKTKIKILKFLILAEKMNKNLNMYQIASLIKCSYPATFRHIQDLEHKKHIRKITKKGLGRKTSIIKPNVVLGLESEEIKHKLSNMSKLKKQLQIDYKNALERDSQQQKEIEELFK